MEKVSLYMKLVCMISILSGVLISLIPKGRLKGSFISLCSVVTISAMVIPLSSLTYDGISALDFDSPDSSQIYYEETENEIYGNVFASAAEEKLREENITASVSVKIIQVQDEAVIESVTVIGSFDDTTKKRIISVLGDGFSNAEIIFEVQTDG